jgi:hypothetical protein
MKLTGLYLAWDVDPEQDGWYLPDQGQLVDIEGAVGLATGVFKVENFVWILAGRPRTHRRAMWVYLKDLRTGLWARDYRRLIYSTDFAGLSTLPLSYFAPGVSDLIMTSSGQAVAGGLLPTGVDGGRCEVVEGLTDLGRISYEQTAGAVNQGQVVAYDRRGEANGPVRGAGERWEEIYGPDYPYSWLGPTPESMDTPVLENGRCRVRYDATHTPGWRIDVWTIGGWEEQGKVCIKRRDREESIEENYDTELLSASLVEYSETRAVILAVMKTPANPYSREEVFITLQRGWSGPRFEVYPAPGVFSITEVDAFIIFTLATGDTDNSVIKPDASENAIEATAMGTGHTGLWPTEGENLLVGAESFTGENFVIVGRWGRPYGITAAVVQAEAFAEVFASTAAYGTASTPVKHNALQIQSRYALHYMSAHFGFPEQAPLLALEAESMTLGAGTSVTADAAASGGHATFAIRTTDANAHISVPAWPGGPYGSGTYYLVFARVKTSHHEGATLHIYASAYTTGPTQTTTSSSYVWICLGEINVNNTALAIHCWAPDGDVTVDRIEAFLLDDRNTEQGGTFEGGRDRGNASLVDSRTIPTLVAR